MYQRAVDTMNRLIGVDLDAKHVYERVLEKTEDQDLRARFREIRDQHQRHVERLTPLVRDRGGVPEEHGDPEGFLLEELAKIEVHDRASALRAAHHVARFAFKDYEDAMGEELELEVVHAIRDGYADAKAAHHWLDEEIHGPEHGRVRRTA